MTTSLALLIGLVNRDYFGTQREIRTCIAYSSRDIHDPACKGGF